MTSSCCPCITGLKIVNSDKPVPLKSIDVNVTVKGFVANVTSVLVYKNTDEEPIEVIYKFPIDDQGAVYHFEAQIEGRTIIAECQEKQQAKETYKEAVDQGFSATYMEQDDSSSDVFTCKVGNIPPGTELTLTFAYVTELTLKPDGLLQFSLYTLLNPRYNPDPASGGVINPPTVGYIAPGGAQPYTFTFKAKIINASKVTNVTSVKDELSVTYSEEKTEVTLAKPFTADHDLSLDITYEDVCKPHVIVEPGKDALQGLLKEKVVMLNFFPDLKDSDYTGQHEFIIVIDRSGSMMGPRIESARDTLLLFLKSLPAGCYFNIVGFGSHFDKVFPNGSQELSESSMTAALAYQKSLQADFGGTEILQPLEDIYSKAPMSTHSRQIFLLTDGEVHNTQQIIDVVHKNANNSRVFTIGIGEGASTSLVKGVARAGCGRAEFIKENERMQPLVMKTLKAAMQTGVTDLQLDWQLGGSVQLTQVPKELPPLFGGDRLIIYAIPAGQSVLDGRVELKGKIGERSLSLTLDITTAKIVQSDDESLPIHRLAAKAHIKLLQDAEKDEPEKNKAAIILVSTAANIISRHTAMVGVDKERSERVTGKRTIYEVPHITDPTLQYDTCSVSANFSGIMPQMLACRAPVAMGKVLALGGGGGFAMRSCPAPATPLGMPMAKCMQMEVESDDMLQDVNAPPTYMSVVELQSFAGSWKLDASLAKIAGVPLEQLEKANSAKLPSEVWGTLVALAVLEEKFSETRDEWEMIEMKAKQWLHTQNLAGQNLSSLIGLAKKAIIPAK